MAGPRAIKELVFRDFGLRVQGLGTWGLGFSVFAGVRIKLFSVQGLGLALARGLE